MKPMKNTAIKKGTGESVPSVKNYFKNIPIGSKKGIDENKCKTLNGKAVYVQALKDRLASYNGETEEEHTASKCGVMQNQIEADVAVDRTSRVGKAVLESDSIHHEIDESDIALDETKTCDASCELLRQKYKDLKLTHMKLCLQHCEISMKYNELVKTLDAVKLSKLNSDIAGTSGTGNNGTETSTHVGTSDVASNANLSPSTNAIFTENQIRVLESIPLEKSKDSNFILQCITYAYSDNPETLANKTLKGTLERKEFREGGAVVVRPAKGSLTPEKVTRIEQLFISRVVKSKCLSGEFAERIKSTNINRHIASAIGNVTSKHKLKNSSSKKNINLNL